MSACTCILSHRWTWNRSSVPQRTPARTWSQSLCILKETNIASPFNTFHHIRGQDNCTPCMYVIAYECMCVFRASRRRAGHSPPLNPHASLSKCPQSITYGNSHALLTWTIASSRKGGGCLNHESLEGKFGGWKPGDIYSEFMAESNLQRKLIYLAMG